MNDDDDDYKSVDSSHWHRDTCWIAMDRQAEEEKTNSLKNEEKDKIQFLIVIV